MISYPTVERKGPTTKEANGAATFPNRPPTEAIPIPMLLLSKYNNYHHYVHGVCLYKVGMKNLNAKSDRDLCTHTCVSYFLLFSLAFSVFLSFLNVVTVTVSPDRGREELRSIQEDTAKGSSDAKLADQR